MNENSIYFRCLKNIIWVTLSIQYASVYLITCNTRTSNSNLVMKVWLIAWCWNKSLSYSMVLKQMVNDSMWRALVLNLQNSERCIQLHLFYAWKRSCKFHVNGSHIFLKAYLIGYNHVCRYFKAIPTWGFIIWTIANG